MNKFVKFKKYYLYGLIGSLIAAAIVAVTVILAGQFDDTTSRVLGTLALVVAHSLVSLSLVREDNSKLNHLVFFYETLFFIVVSSLIVSLLVVWQAITSDLTFRIYGVFTLLAFTSLHYNVVYLIRNKDKLITQLVRLNYILIGIVGIMAMPFILINNLPDIYGRGLAALAVIDITITVICAILYKLYLQKHPSEANAFALGGKSSSLLKVVLVIVAGYILLNLTLALIFLIVSLLN